MTRGRGRGRGRGRPPERNGASRGTGGKKRKGKGAREAEEKIIDDHKNYQACYIEVIEQLTDKLIFIK